MERKKLKTKKIIRIKKKYKKNFLYKNKIKNKKNLN